MVLMDALKVTLLNILKYTRIEIDPGEELDISYILRQLNKRCILTESEIRLILAKISE
jgi:hypothetical protein